MLSLAGGALQRTGGRVCHGGVGQRGWGGRRRGKKGQELRVTPAPPFLLSLPLGQTSNLGPEFELPRGGRPADGKCGAQNIPGKMLPWASLGLPRADAPSRLPPLDILLSH